MLGLLKQPIEKKLSALLGTTVSFESLNFSVFGGSADARGIVVKGTDPAVSLLTIERVRAEVSLGAALKKEFAIKSLTIEKPILTLTRNAAGQFNLPQRNPAESAVSDTVSSPRQTSASPSDTVTDNNAIEESSGSWKLDARKVLVVDGQAHYQDATGYRAAIPRLLAELKEGNGGFDITFLGESAGRTDHPIDLGNLQFTGRAANMANVSQWKQATITGELTVADILHAQINAPSLNPIAVNAEINGLFDVKRIAPLLPPYPAIQNAMHTFNPSGRVQMTGKVDYRTGHRLSFPDLILRALDFAFAIPSR